MAHHSIIIPLTAHYADCTNSNTHISVHFNNSSIKTVSSKQIMYLKMRWKFKKSKFLLNKRKEKSTLTFVFTNGTEEHHQSFEKSVKGVINAIAFGWQVITKISLNFKNTQS